jgi:TPR repeat protein/DNA-binding transcriptional regulator GbsR (MarR family)
MMPIAIVSVLQSLNFGGKNMYANPRPLVATIYNPHNQSKAELIAGFVVRKKFFDKIFRDIQTSTMQRPEQHYIIQGLRGMGKTTMLLRIAYEIENTEGLKNWLIPVVFNEEEYGISSLSDLWERVAELLEENSTEFLGLYDKIAIHRQSNDYERLALDIILKTLQTNQKKIILLIDNIGDILEKFDERDEQRLREVLMSIPEIRLIGATSIFLENLFDYKRPFFDFFRYQYLEGLTKDESLDLMLKLGEIFHEESIKNIVENEPHRVEILRRLTGGVVRTMVLLFEIFVENNTGSAFKDLEILIDRVTPLYKSRMDDLPKQQQKIVASLANFWEAATAKELAESVRMESKVVSAQLQQLIKNRIVTKVETNTKNHLYRLEERFFNIWYLMRFGRKTDQRMLWLVKFMEEFIGGDEDMLQNRIDGHLKAISNKTIDPKAAVYLTEALKQLTKNDLVRYDLVRKTENYLKEYAPEYLTELDTSDSKDYDIVIKAMSNSWLNDDNICIDSLNEFLKVNRKGVFVLEQIAMRYIQLKKYPEAEKYCIDAVDKGSAYALSILGDIKLKQGDVNNAIKYYTKAYKKGESFALVELGKIYQRTDYQKAMKYYKMAFKEGEIWWMFNLDHNRMRFRTFIMYNNIFRLYHIFHTFVDNYIRLLEFPKLFTKVLYYGFFEKNISELVKNWLKVKPLFEEENEIINTLDNLILLCNNEIDNLKIIQSFEWLQEVRNRFTENHKGNKNYREPSIFNNDSYALRMLFSNFLKMLLVKRQYYTAYKYFQNDILLEDFLTYYYATLHYLKDEYPIEYLRMPPEMKETVEELVAEIEQMAIDYA